MTIHISRGPSAQYADIESETRWCFGCRAHTPHHWTLYAGPFDEGGLCWYDPTWAHVCESCGKDRTRFPG